MGYPLATRPCLEVLPLLLHPRSTPRILPTTSRKVLAINLNDNYGHQSWNCTEQHFGLISRTGIKTSKEASNVSLTRKLLSDLPKHVFPILHKHRRSVLHRILTFHSPLPLRSFRRLYPQSPTACWWSGFSPSWLFCPLLIYLWSCRHTGRCWWLQELAIMNLAQTPTDLPKEEIWKMLSLILGDQ